MDSVKSSIEAIGSRTGTAITSYPMLSGIAIIALVLYIVYTVVIQGLYFSSGDDEKKDGYMSKGYQKVSNWRTGGNMPNWALGGLSAGGTGADIYIAESAGHKATAAGKHPSGLLPSKAQRAAAKDPSGADDAYVSSALGTDDWVDFQDGSCRNVWSAAAKAEAQGLAHLTGGGLGQQGKYSDVKLMAAMNGSGN